MLNSKLQVKRISGEDTYKIRHLVLRQGQAFKECAYPLDQEKETGHFGIYQDDRLVGVASIFYDANPDFIQTSQWRIRGMAILPEFQGKGMGQQLLQACIEHAKKNRGNIIWCKARATAVIFYEKFGFLGQGDPYELERPGLSGDVVKVPVKLLYKLI